MPIRLGTARAVRGQMTYGAYKLVSHPTGGNDTLPVLRLLHYAPGRR